MPPAGLSAKASLHFPKLSARVVPSPFQSNLLSLSAMVIKEFSGEFPDSSYDLEDGDFAKVKQQGHLMPGTGTEDSTPILRNGLHHSSLVRGWPDRKTVYDLFQKGGLKVNPNGPYLGHRPVILRPDPANPSRTIRTWSPTFVWQTYKEVAEKATLLGSGLVALQKKYAHGDKAKETKWCFGIYALNRPEWIIAEQASYCYNVITTVLYDTLGPEVIEYIVNHAEASIVVTSADKVPILLNLREKMPNCGGIVSMDSLADERGAILKSWAKQRGIDLLDFDEVYALGKKNRLAHTPPTPEDIVTICYTSGTTGLPKGAILTHENIVSAARATSLSGAGINKDDTYVSYLPLAHIYERFVIQGVAQTGAKVGFFRGDVLQLIEDMSILKPTVFASVPRLLNRIYDRVMAQATGGTQLRKTLFETALKTKLELLKTTGSNKHAFWDRLVFNKVKAVIGGRVRIIISGSAPINPDVLAFLRVAFQTTVVEGYGQTETSACGNLTWPGDMSAGHLGPPPPCMEEKLISIPEMNYLVTDKPYPRGEIAMRGYNITPGYWKDEKKTKELFTPDGWLLTGDVGMLDERGRISIIDRKKNIFKLAQGEYVAPEKIEQTYQKSDYVLQIFVHGDSLRAELVAIVVPDFEMVLAKVAKKGWGTTPQELCRSAEFRKLILADMNAVGKTAKLRGFEFVKAIHLEPELFSIDNGMLTPTQKVKRPEAKAKYANEIAALYAQIDAMPKAQSKL